ncbi:MAG: hypothetical protein ACQERB_00205 [Promethearchaeati archaeon]
MKKSNLKISRKWIGCVLAFGTIGTIFVPVLELFIAIHAIPILIIGVVDHVGGRGRTFGAFAYRGVECSLEGLNFIIRFLFFT